MKEDNNSPKEIFITSTLSAISYGSIIFMNYFAFSPQLTLPNGSILPLSNIGKIVIVNALIFTSIICRNKYVKISLSQKNAATIDKNQLKKSYLIMKCTPLIDLAN